MKTYSFQEARPAPPPDAETFPASDFQRRVKKPSKFVAGVDVETRVQTCPVCVSDLPIEHGDRFECKCGHTLELYGNVLSVWKTGED